MKIYRQQFTSSDFSQKFSKQSPIWKRSSKASLPEISGYSDDQADIQSYEDTSLKAVFERMLPEEQLEAFFGKIVTPGIISPEEQFNDGTDIFRDNLERLDDMIDQAEAWREEYNLPDTMTISQIFEHVQKISQEGVKKYGNIIKNSGDSRPARTGDNSNVGDSSNDSKPSGENNKQGGEEK